MAGFVRENDSGVSSSGAKDATTGIKAAPSRVESSACCFKASVESLKLHTGQVLNRIQNRIDVMLTTALRALSSPRTSRCWPWISLLQCRLIRPVLDR